MSCRDRKLILLSPLLLAWMPPKLMRLVLHTGMLNPTNNFHATMIWHDTTQYKECLCLYSTFHKCISLLEYVHFQSPSCKEIKIRQFLVIQLYVLFLKGRVMEREIQWEKEKQLSSICWITTKITAIAWSRPGWSQKSGFLPTCVAEVTAPWPSFTIFHCLPRLNSRELDWSGAAGTHIACPHEMPASQVAA